MSIVVTLWWLGFWTAVGLCLGSFLNVVIYRLPRGRSLREPLWSACPSCDHPIAWYDNLPILSFVLLGGRCRHCRMPIATRYLVVEALMATVVLLLVDAFFVGQIRPGLQVPDFALTDQLSYDWPILLGHVILFACLISMSAIDLEYYWVDIRFTNIATVAGFALHALWTPRHSMEWIRPFDTTAIMSVFAVGGLGLVWLVFICQPHTDPEDFEDPSREPEPEATPEPVSEPEPEPAGPLHARKDLAALLTPPSRLPGWIAGLILAALFLSMALTDRASPGPWNTMRILLPLLFCFVLIVQQSAVTRDSDREIVDAIHEERHEARRMVLTEFALLLPALVLAVVGFCVMSGGGEHAERMSDVLHARVRVGGLAMLRHWEPLYGLGTAASGYVIAATIGWGVRIVFTMVFGKEAFGTGDVHLMAATGCIAGWPVVALGFILSCGLALVGWLTTLPFKRARAVPLGPWLSLSFLIVVLFYGPMMRFPVVARAADLAHMLFLRN